MTMTNKGTKKLMDRNFHPYIFTLDKYFLNAIHSCIKRVKNNTNRNIIYNDLEKIKKDILKSPAIILFNKDNNPYFLNSENKIQDVISTQVMKFTDLRRQCNYFDKNGEVYIDLYIDNELAYTNKKFIKGKVKWSNNTFLILRSITKTNSKNFLNIFLVMKFENSDNYVLIKINKLVIDEGSQLAPFSFIQKMACLPIKDYHKFLSIKDVFYLNNLISTYKDKINTAYIEIEDHVDDNVGYGIWMDYIDEKNNNQYYAYEIPNFKKLHFLYPKSIENFKQDQDFIESLLRVHEIYGSRRYGITIFNILTVSKDIDPKYSILIPTEMIIEEKIYMKRTKNVNIDKIFDMEKKLNKLKFEYNKVEEQLNNLISQTK